MPTIADFVGRARELGLLEEALHAAAAGAGRAVFLSGAAGVGKTTTAERLAERAEASGATVRWGRCHDEGEGAPPFWPWVQVLRGAVPLLSAAALRRAVGDGARDLAQLVPDVCEPAPDAVPAAAADLVASRFRLFDAVASLLRAVARRGPLAIVLEDLHGADQSSLQLLQFVVREAPRAALLVVGTYRDGTRTGSHPLDETLAEALRAPGTLHLPLAGFGQDEVRQLLAAKLAAAPAPELVAAVHRRAEGNPLFIAEFVRGLAAQPPGGPPHAAAELVVPDTVRAVIRRRLAGLAPATRHALELAAVMGRDLHVDALLRAVAEPQLGTALAEGIARGVLGETPAAGGRLRFAHALFVETLYEDLSVSRRLALHRCAADAFAALPDPAPFQAELAHHLRRAGDPVSLRRAGDHARRAGDDAMRVGAFEEAERLYEDALRMREAHGGDDAQGRAELLIALGRVRNVGRTRDDARAAFRDAAACARRLPPSHATSVLLADAALGFAGDWTGINEVPTSDAHPMTCDPEVVDLLEEALAVVGPDPSPERARLLARLAQELFFEAPPERRERMAGEAIDIARRLGDPGTLAYVITLAHTATWRAGNTVERAALMAEGIAAARRAQDGNLVAAGHGLEVMLMLERGRARAAKRAAVLFARAAVESRQPFLLWALGVQQAMWAMLDGRLADGERLAHEALEHGRRGRASPMRHYVLQLVELWREQGRADELRRMAGLLRLMAEQFPGLASIRAQASFLSLEAGDVDAAASDFELAARHDFADVRDDLSRNRCLAELAEVAAALGDAGRAALLYGMLRPHADTYVIGLGATSCWGSMHRTLGLLATTLRRWDDAQTHFETARRANAELGARVPLVRTQHQHAAMLLSRAQGDDRASAARLVADALASAERAGMTALAARLRALDAARPTGAASAPAVPSAAAFVVHEGDYWTIGYAGQVIRLRDTKGVHYIAHLLHRAGEEVHVLDLVCVCRGADAAETGWSGRPVADGIGPRLDAQAASAYRRRLAELGAQIEDGERDHDVGRVERLREEQRFLQAQLAEAFGVGGRARPTGAHAERARLTVTKRISDTIRKIGGAHPALAHHLSTSLKRGYFCVYEPGPTGAPRWEVGRRDGGPG